MWFEWEPTSEGQMSCCDFPLVWVKLQQQSRMKINWVAWFLVLVCWFFLTSQIAAYQSNKPTARHTKFFLVPTVNIQRCRWVCALTKTIDRWLYPEGHHSTHFYDRREAIHCDISVPLSPRAKCRTTTRLVVKPVTVSWLEWPGHISSGPHQLQRCAVSTLKAAINIHCCRWVYLRITHWSMNADCGSNTSITNDSDKSNWCVRRNKERCEW